jgi:hypothetical protein
LKLILRIITKLTYICWEIVNFVTKSDLFRRFFICKNILQKLSCYHDNYFRYFMFGKYNGFVSKAWVSACMYFLITSYFRSKLINYELLILILITVYTWQNYCNLIGYEVCKYFINCLSSVISSKYCNFIGLQECHLSINRTFSELQSHPCLQPM